MNVIYNILDKKVYLFAAHTNLIQMNILDLNPQFLKKKELTAYDKEKHDEKDSNWVKKEIKNGDIIVELKYSEGKGIFIQIKSNDNNEVLLIDTIQKEGGDNDKEVFKKSGLAWSSSSVDYYNNIMEKLLH